VPGELSHRALRFCGVAYSSREHDVPGGRRVDGGAREGSESIERRQNKAPLFWKQVAGFLLCFSQLSASRQPTWNFRSLARSQVVRHAMSR